MQSSPTSLCNRLIKWGFYLLFGLVPLLLTPLNYELFEYNKMMAVYALTVIIVSSWIIKSIARREIRISRTPLDIPIALFVASQLISTLFSIDPHVSWFGYYSRFNGGMWSVISYVLLYYTFLSNSDIFTPMQNPSEIAPINNKASKKEAPKQKITIQQSNNITILLRISLLTATFVAIYGLLERLGIDKHLWVQDVQNRVFSTMGQPNWLASYLVALIPLSMAFAFQAQLSKRNPDRIGVSPDWIGVNPDWIGVKDFGFWIWSLLSVLFFLVLLFTRSRSGLLGFVVADIVFWFLLIVPKVSKRVLHDIKKHPLIKPIAALHIVFALLVFVHGIGVPALDQWITFGGLQTTITTMTKTATVPKETVATPSAVAAGPALEVGGTESGTIRKYVWQGAINAWKSSPKTLAIGTGTETFAFAFYQFRPVGHNLTSEWDFLYNKAHNEYLNYLATTGIFGLGSYMLFIGTFMVWFISKIRKQITENRKNTNTSDYFLFTIHCSLFAGWLSILVTNFFGFSVVVVQIFLFLLPAVIFALSPDSRNRGSLVFSPDFRNRGNFVFSPDFRNRRSFDSGNLHLRLSVRALWLPAVCGLIVVFRIASFWYADTLYARGYRLIRAGLYGQAIPPLTSAIGINGSEPTYHDELAGAYATLAVAAFEGSNATQAAQLAVLAVNASSQAIRTSPHNVNFYKTRTKVYYTLSAIEPTMNAKAVETLKQTERLSPNDPKIYYNLAILVGRDGDTDQAISYLLKAKKLKPNYKDAYYALWVFYTEENRLEEARAIAREYIDTVDPNDKDFLEKIK